MSVKELNQEELSVVTGGLEEGENSYSLKIVSYKCSKDTVAKLIKEMLAIGYKEAQELVDSLPKTIKERMCESEANYWENKFISNDISVEIKKY